MIGNTDEREIQDNCKASEFYMWMSVPKPETFKKTKEQISEKTMCSNSCGVCIDTAVWEVIPYTCALQTVGYSNFKFKVIMGENYIFGNS